MNEQIYSKAKSVSSKQQVALNQSTPHPNHSHDATNHNNLYHMHHKLTSKTNFIPNENVSF
jgi:hypothetical protein